MPEFELYDEDTAPQDSRATMAAARSRFGFVPNLLAVMAESPQLIKAYAAVSDLFAATSLSPVEQQVVLLTASFENECTYCVAAHSTVAEMVSAPAPVIEALRTGTPVPDPKLEALRRFTAAVVSGRGRPGPDTVAAFLAAGYSRTHMFEVLVGVAQKTLSNYTNHMAGTPLDGAFTAHEWTPPPPPHQHQGA